MNIARARGLAESLLDPVELPITADRRDYVDGVQRVARQILDALQDDEVTMLRRCISEHHAVGALDSVLVGDQCPICKEWLR